MTIDIRGVCALLQVYDANEPAVTHYGMKQVYVSDPDGYLLCFQWEATPPEQPVP